MHPNPVFHTATDAENLAFARSRAFGTLAISADTGPLLSHIPFALHDDGATLDIHLLRSNPILRALETPQPAVLAVMGPDAYISPDWYGVPDQVPTWNYVAVHLRGRLSRLDHDEMHAMLDRQTAVYEDRLLPKAPWTSAKMTPDVLDRMMRQIVPCRMTVEAVDGTWKLGQNKAPDVRLAAAVQVDANGHLEGLGAGAEPLSRLMMAPPHG